jgi:hypothetical protein
VYGLSVCRIWPWISAELSWLDAGTMLALLLIMLGASQYIPEAREDQGRFEFLVSLYFFMAVFMVRFIVLIVISTFKNGFFGEFVVNPFFAEISLFNPPNRIETSQFWLKWLEYSQDIPNTEIADTICKMNVFDRLSIHKFMSSWNAVAVESATASHSTTGSKTRLERVPSRIRVSKQETSRVSRSSKRVSVSISNELGTMGAFNASGSMSSCDQSSTTLPSLFDSQVDAHMNNNSDQDSIPKPSIFGTNPGTDSEEMCTF